MRLRTQILLSLFLFGLAPLLAAVFMNMPLVFDRLELFYHRAHLQSLRADFRDLDQHLASRHETVRLLAKFSAHSNFLADGLLDAGRLEPGARARLTEWLNLILRDQLDVIQVLFVDDDGRPSSWFERDPDTLELRPGDVLKDPPPPRYVEAGLDLEPGTVLPSPVRFSKHGGVEDPTRFMMLQLITPIVPGFAETPVPGAAHEVLGAVVVNVDIGGIARAYRDTYWVHADGTYLGQAGGAGRYSAFADFPGLEALFEHPDLSLWEGPHGERVIWVPLLATEQEGPLWVGRRVDAEPISSVSRALQWRIGLVLVALVAVILVAARWIASRAERLRGELTDGVTRVLEGGEPVRFDWRGSRELQQLGLKLSQLAQVHAENVDELHARARKLEESNRYKSEFLANVSHELKTPLNSILLLSKLLAENPQGALQGEQLSHARVINAAGLSLKQLIDDILDLSRIEAGKAVFHLDWVEVPDLLQDLVDLVQAQAVASGLDLRLRVDEGAPARVFTDRDKIAQILRNFLSNAVKFTREGVVELALEQNDRRDSGARPVRIAVTDTGIGIPGGKHEVVFEAFQQADGSTSRRYGGTGLGLTISRELARLVGGRIVLTSEAGKGSTFALLLPLEFDRSTVDADQIELIAAEQLQPAAEDAAMPDGDFRGRRVLVVDDDVHNLLALTPLLEHWGIQVAGAGDGQEALDTLAEDPDVDLILLDMMLPGLDGLETARRIRGLPGLAGVPVLLMTGYPVEDESAWQAGVTDILRRPVTPEALREVLGRLWGTPAPAAAAG